MQIVFVCVWWKQINFTDKQIHKVRALPLLVLYCPALGPFVLMPLEQFFNNQYLHISIR